MADDLRARVAEALRLRLSPVHAPGSVLAPEAAIDYIGLTEFELADAVMAVVAPQLDAEPVDRCARCLCSDCGGRLDQHTENSCVCSACQDSPSLACSLAEFAPDERIGFIAEQLGPLLSSHLNERARLRCLAVAHAAHHALHDYDSKETLS